MDHVGELQTEDTSPVVLVEEVERPEARVYGNPYNDDPTLPGTADATATFPLDPKELIFEEDRPYVEPATAGDGDQALELPADSFEEKMFDAHTNYYTSSFSVDLSK